MTRPALFQAVWPVLGAQGDPADLFREAAADLVNVARRHHVAPVGRATYAIRPGVDVPGCGGAALVVVAHTMTVEVPRVVR